MYLLGWKTGSNGPLPVSEQIPIGIMALMIVRIVIVSSCGRDTAFMAFWNIPTPVIAMGTKGGSNAAS